VGDCLCCCWC